jgi:hypothetical protein
MLMIYEGFTASASAAATTHSGKCRPWAVGRLVMLGDPGSYLGPLEYLTHTLPYRP